MAFEASRISFKVALTCLLLALSLWSPVSAAEATRQIPVEQLLAIVEAFESRIQVVRWRVQTEKAILTSADDWESVAKRPNYSIKGTVLFDPKLQRFHAAFESVLPWQDGLAPFAASRTALAFDGDIHRRWRQSVPGTSLPTEDVASNGSISKSETEGVEREAFIKGWGGPLGVGYMPPNFAVGLSLSEPKPLSEFIKGQVQEGRPLAIDVVDDAHWLIRTTVPFKNGLPCTVHIDFDAEKGAITGVEWRSGENADVVWMKRLYSLQQVGEGIWTPANVREVAMLQKPPRLHTITFSDIEINPPVSAESFRISFPPGTRLVDHIAEKSYRVGFAGNNQADAVKGFMAQHGLRQSSADLRFNARQWLLLGNVILVFVIVAALWFRAKKRKESRVGSAALIAIVAFGSYANPILDVTACAEVVSYNDGEAIHVSQCGADVCCFALEYFGAKYEAKKVNDALPSENEASVKDVQDMLRAHGLQVDTREGVNLRDLKRALDGHNLAILPLFTNEESRHFFVAVRDNHQRLVLVDVLRNVRPLDEALKEPMLAKAEGLVVFVSRKSSAMPMSEFVEIEPAIIDLGVLSLSGPEASKPKEAIVRIHNRSDSPAMVLSVTTSCGCARPEWEGGLIRANGSQEMKFVIMPSSWGDGRGARNAVLQFADESTARVKIIAEGRSAETIQQLTITPKVFRVDVTDRLSSGSDKSLPLEAHIRGTDEAIAELTVSSDESWLKPTLSKSSGSLATLHIDVQLEDPNVKQLGDRFMELAGKVVLTRSDDRPAVPIAVRLFHRALHVEPSFVSLSHDPDRRSLFEIYGDAGETEPHLKLIKYESTPQGLNIDSHRKEGERVAVSVRATKETAPGLYVVNCLVETATNKRSKASFVVKVPE